MIYIHQNTTQIYFKSFKVSDWRLFKNASEFQGSSVRDFQFDEKLKNGGLMPMIVKVLFFTIIMTKFVLD